MYSSWIIILGFFLEDFLLRKKKKIWFEDFNFLMTVVRTNQSGISHCGESGSGKMIRIRIRKTGLMVSCYNLIIPLQLFNLLVKLALKWHYFDILSLFLCVDSATTWSCESRRSRIWRCCTGSTASTGPTSGSDPPPSLSSSNPSMTPPISTISPTWIWK